MPATISVLDAAAAPQTVNTLPALGQAAKAASLPVVIASDDDLQAKFGIVTETAPASDTASSGLNGRLQRIAQRLTSLIAQIPATLGQTTKAASLSVALASDQGTLAVGGNSVVVGGSFSRPADTTAYVLGDLVTNNTTAGSVTPVACAAARVNAGTGVIRRIRLSTNHTGLAGSEVFRIHLFKTSPTVTNGDNGVFAANGIASIALGYTDITLSHIYNDGSKGFTATDIVFDAAGGSQNIYGLIEARGSYTPISSETFTLALEVLQD